MQEKEKPIENVSKKSALDTKTLLAFLTLEGLRKNPQPKKKVKGVKQTKAERVQLYKKEKKEKKLRKMAAKSKKINRRR